MGRMPCGGGALGGERGVLRLRVARFAHNASLRMTNLDWVGRALGNGVCGVPPLRNERAKMGHPLSRWCGGVQITPCQTPSTGDRLPAPLVRRLAHAV